MKLRKVLSVLFLVLAVFVLTACNGKTYKVTFFDWDDEVLETQKILKGKDAVKPEDPIRKGYEFIGWDTEFLNVKKDLKIIAIYEINYYTVTWRNYDDTVLKIEEKMYPYGETPEYQDSDPIRDTIEDFSYIFYGWTPLVREIEKDIVYTAKFIQSEYTVTFKDHDDTILKTEKLSYQGKATPPEDPEREHYEFIKWDKDFTNVTEDLVVKAVYKANEFTVTYDVDGGVNIPVKKVKMDEHFTLPIPVKKDYAFDGWLYLEENIGLTIQFTYADNITLKAKWIAFSEGVKYEVVEDKAIILQYVGDEETLILPDTIEGHPITKIDKEAFKDNSTLKLIKIGQKLVSIGNEAFSNMENLEKIIIPSSVTTIGENAFSGNDNLVIFGEGIGKPVGWNDNWNPGNRPVLWNFLEFANDGLLSYAVLKNETVYLLGLIDELLTTDIEISEKIKGYKVISIFTEAFANEEITKIVIPEGITSIGNSAFMNASNLESIVIPNSVKSIGNSAFKDATKLKTVMFDEDSKLEVIGDSAFMNASDLESIVIPDSVRSIGNSAFSGASELNSIKMPFVGQSRTATGESGRLSFIFGQTDYSGSYNVNGYFLPETLTTIVLTNTRTISNNAFDGAVSITEIELPEGLTSIGSSAFAKLSGLTEIVVPSSVTSIGFSSFSGASGLTTMTLPFVGQTRTATSNQGVFGFIFGQNNYPDSYDANGYYLPEGLTEIIITNDLNVANDAFYKANKLKNIEFSNTARTFGTSVFKEVSELVNLTISSEAAYELKHYFGGNIADVPTSLKTITYAKESTIIDKTLIIGDLLDVSLVLAKDTKIILSEQFRKTNIKNVVIPNSVTTIETLAFAEMPLLKNVIFEENSNLRSIDERAFYKASSLENITIPKSVTNLGKNIFQFTDNLKIVTFESESQLKEIDDNVFEGATGLIEIIIPEGVETIGSSAFAYTNNLSTILISNTVTTIGYRAFYNAEKLLNVNFQENSQLITIGSGAFSYASSLGSITIPKSVVNLKNNVFTEAKNLKEIIFEEDSQLTNIGYGAFSYLDSLESLIIPSNVTSIGSVVFYGSSKLNVYLLIDSKPEGFAEAWNSTNIPVYWQGQWSLDEEGNPQPK